MGVSTVTIKPVCLIVGFICLAKFRGRINLLFSGISGRAMTFLLWLGNAGFHFWIRFSLSRFLGCVLGSLIFDFGDDFRFPFFVVLNFLPRTLFA